jgi:hypothetical protein
MSFEYIFSVRAGIILFVLFALYSNSQLLLESVGFDLGLIGKDDITLYERRFDGVKQVLPSYGVIGYIGDALKNADGSLNAGAMRNWYLAQYTLAPVVLSTDPGHRLFLMNKSSDSTDSDSLKKGGSTVQEPGSDDRILNFGHGVKLLRNESQ